jgi:chromosome segregation protein
MEDVIFGGTEKRTQTGFAEVSLILDNLDGTLDIENTEIVLTRRYYRSGESEYYLNRKPARLRDILEILMDTGLGREGYSVIGQGKIAEILSVRSTDRREIFEEAVGISRYRHRREESERKLKAAQENLLRINDKISELELTLAPLREQSETARKFLILRDELRALEVSLWAKQLERLREEIVKSDIDLLSAEAAIAKASAASERLYADIEELEADRRRTETDADAIRADSAALERSLAELNTVAAELRVKIENNSTQIESINLDLTRQTTREESVTAQISERETRIAELSASRESTFAAIAELERDRETLLAQAEGEEREALLIAERERTAALSAADTRARITALSVSAQDLYDRETAAASDIYALDEAIAAAKSELHVTDEEAKTTANAAAELQNAMRGYELRVTSRREKAADAEARASKLAAELDAVQTREKMLTDMERDFEGYNKSVRFVMQDAQRGALKGIYGTAGSLLQTDDKYALAIETALGGSVQSVIVESEEDGKAAINMLRRRDGGRATFLPISTVRGNILNERGLDNEAGFEGIALELCNFDSKFRDVLASLLGRVAIVDNLDSAIAVSRKYSAKFKVVTLDGQVINAGGAMTGGSTARGSGIISRAGELTRLREKIAALGVDAKAAKNERDERERERAAAEFELESARAEKLAADDASMRAQNELDAAVRLVSERESALADLKSQIEDLRAKSADNTKDTENLRAELSALETEIATLKVEIASRETALGAVEERRETINAQISEKRAAVAAFDAETDAVTQSITELREIRDGFLGSAASQRETAESLATQNAALRAELDAAETRSAELRAKIDAQTEQSAAIVTRKLELEQKRSELDRRSREQSKETMDLERERSRIEQQKTSREAEEKRIIDRLWDSYEMTRGDAVAQAQELPDTNAANRRVGELRGEISKLGNPNIGAIEEFERVNTRFEFLSSQRDDVENAKRELDAIIADITAEMQRIFSDGFLEIKEKFSETFVELFGGGTATLTLDDPDDVLGCGIEITAQPPGKKLTTITLLSGGEQAFAAIALYFAILKIRPAPFVVLDEIEAALDDANVVRFADYMRKMSVKSQMIVISHRRGTMEEADVLYGVTMQERGVSRIITLDLDDAERIVK